MNIKRKKELLETYKNRRPDMGIISFKCIETQESFLGISKDIKSDINSEKFKLSFKIHPNKLLQNLWNIYSEKGFEISVLKTLTYKNLDEDHTSKLEELREQYLEKNSKSRRIWK